MAILFHLYMYKGGKCAVIAEMWSLSYLSQMRKSVRKVETLADEAGSAQLFWSLLNLRKKEGKSYLNQLWATMTAERKNIVCEDHFLLFVPG